MDPHSFSDYCTQAFYDELRDELHASLGYAPRTHGDAAPPRVPALDVRLVPSAAPPSGGDTPSRCVPPPAAGAATAVAAERTQDRATLGGARSNFNALGCLCGRVGDPTFPWGYCPGGRDCLERIHAQEEEDRLTANQSGPHNEPETEAHMKDTPERNTRAAA